MGDRRNTLSDTINVIITSIFNIITDVFSLILDCGFIFFGVKGMFSLFFNIFKVFIGV